MDEVKGEGNVAEKLDRTGKQYPSERKKGVGGHENHECAQGVTEYDRSLREGNERDGRKVPIAERPDDAPRGHADRYGAEEKASREEKRGGRRSHPPLDLRQIEQGSKREQAEIRARPDERQNGEKPDSVDRPR